MLKDAKVNGNMLTITVELVKPYQSKTALQKAAKAGLAAETVPANVVASSGGFVKIATGQRISLNVLAN